MIYRFGYNPAGNGRWVSLNLKRKKKAGARRKKKVEAQPIKQVEEHDEGDSEHEGEDEDVDMDNNRLEVRAHSRWALTKRSKLHHLRPRKFRHPLPSRKKRRTMRTILPRLSP